MINMLLVLLQKIFGVVSGRLYYLMLSGVIGFTLLVGWFFTTIFLGKKFKKEIDSKKVIC